MRVPIASTVLLVLAAGCSTDAGAKAHTIPTDASASLVLEKTP